MTPSTLRELELYYRALADDSRMRIVRLLATQGEHSVSHLARSLDLSQPLMTWHLRRLVRAGIVRTERVGREVRCSFDRQRFGELHDGGFRTLMNRTPGP